MGVAGAEFRRQIWKKPFGTLALGFVLGQGMLRPSLVSGALGPWKLCVFLALGMCCLCLLCCLCEREREGIPFPLSWREGDHT